MKNSSLVSLMTERFPNYVVRRFESEYGMRENEYLRKLGIDSLEEKEIYSREFSVWNIDDISSWNDLYNSGDKILQGDIYCNFVDIPLSRFSEDGAIFPVRYVIGDMKRIGKSYPSIQIRYDLVAVSGDLYTRNSLYRAEELMYVGGNFDAYGMMADRLPELRYIGKDLNIGYIEHAVSFRDDLVIEGNVIHDQYTNKEMIEKLTKKVGVHRIVENPTF